MAKGLMYFSYISRAKVNQLYDQITDFAVEKKSVKRGKQGETSAEAGMGGLFGFIKGNLSAGGRYTHDSEETGVETTVQKATKVIEYIEKNEEVYDLNELIENKAGVTLDAFCYRYKGRFFALGGIYRGESSGLSINGTALSHMADDIILSKSLLIEPARIENAFKEVGPNNGSLVSDMCIINSNVNDFILSLACSFKYFADMGGHWDERDKEWSVSPHSGNWRFFHGEEELWFDSLVFINGRRGNTLMGTPLFLVHTTDPTLVI